MWQRGWATEGSLLCFYLCNRITCVGLYVQENACVSEVPIPKGHNYYHKQVHMLITCSGYCVGLISHSSLSVQCFNRQVGPYAGF